MRRDLRTACRFAVWTVGIAAAASIAAAPAPGALPERRPEPPWTARPSAHASPAEAAAAAANARANRTADADAQLAAAPEGSPAPDIAAELDLDLDADPAAGLDLDVLASSCGCEASREALAALRDRIEAAPDVEAARELALAQTRLASGALRRARWLVPWSGELREAEERLDRYEDDVRAAPTAGRVADRFAGLVRIASLEPSAVALSPSAAYGHVEVQRHDLDVHFPDCHFTTGEIIAIVLGLILGIIPGIILFVLLC